MVLQMQGIIKGNTIELTAETYIPYGSTVMVNIIPPPLVLKEKKHLIDVLCGSWLGDDSLGAIFKDIAEQRLTTVAREASFDVAS